MDPDAQRARPPAKPATTTQILRDLAAEARRNQRPVDTNTRTSGTGPSSGPVVDDETDGFSDPTWAGSTATLVLPVAGVWLVFWIAQASYPEEVPLRFEGPLGEMSSGPCQDGFAITSGTWGGRFGAGDSVTGSLAVASPSAVDISLSMRATYLTP